MITRLPLHIVNLQQGGLTKLENLKSFSAFSIGIGVTCIYLSDISGNTWFIKVCSVSDNTVKPDLNGHSTIDQTKVLKQISA